ncbi:LysR family transcriptional regulator [Actibacterium sp. 188UL27-1]|uniref:LysR family transcriptional regulator n=1 Tax=Actibacterium sp. 188UL27-1 TaxID=2786961 RepID=UPI00195C5577|nr:LysR family transcriptional regulator [Actibacterium sp. 188UL27-1]MBM7069513.1 LysR family transcriptional regulator [Actibacterium sp. 188UL27-1]
MDAWDEVRTAYHVARLGTVSGAAEVLGVHHATVIRHIDALEGRLGTKLFQRHARGYTPTEAGDDLLLVAQATDDQFSQLAGRIKGLGSDVTGELIITSLPIMSPRLTPILVAFQEAHPEVRIRFVTDERVLRLEYGEAHVAIRAGNQPQEPDNVVQSFFTQHFTLCATQNYVQQQGSLVEGQWSKHRFIGSEDRMSRAPFFQWLERTIPQERIVFRASQLRAAEDAVLHGAGIGFLPCYEADIRPEIVQMIEPRPEWSVQVWLVTHVDLHRTAKVQTLVKYLKEQAREW